MHSMFHMGDNDKFFFDWKYLVESGLSVKDFIAPTSFAFKTNRTFQMGGIYGSMSYLQITASDLSDRMLADFLDMESSQIVTMHIQSVDQTAAIKTIKRTIMASVAIRLAPACQGKGYGTEALSEMTRFCFENTQLQRLWTKVDVRNIPSQRMLEKCGYIKEGLIRQGKMTNTWCDYYIYGILSSDKAGR